MTCMYYPYVLFRTAVEVKKLDLHLSTTVVVVVGDGLLHANLEVGCLFYTVSLRQKVFSETQLPVLLEFSETH